MVAALVLAGNALAGGAEPGDGAYGRPARRVRDARLGAGRRRDRLPDRAHAGRRRQRPHGRGGDHRPVAAAAHGHARRAEVRRRRLRARQPLPVAGAGEIRNDGAAVELDPVFGTTLPQWGTGPGASLRTQWETSGNATYTSDVNEYAYEVQRFVRVQP